MGAWLLLLAIAAVGAIFVVALSELLRRFPILHRRQAQYRLVVANTLLILGFMAASPLYINANWGSPYGDIYGPYILIPGFHIYYPASLMFSGTAFQWLRTYMEPFPASVWCIIIGPGLVGIAAGGVQWWIIGKAWAYWKRYATCLSAAI